VNKTQQIFSKEFKFLGADHPGPSQFDILN